MISPETLRAEIKQLDELQQVLVRLIDVPKFRSNPVVCEIRNRFIEALERHLSHESTGVYRDFLASGDREMEKLANQFMESTRELHRILNKYKKNWCGREPGDQEEYVTETRALMHLMHERIETELTRLLPAMEQMTA